MVKKSFQTLELSLKPQPTLQFSITSVPSEPLTVEVTPSNLLTTWDLTQLLAEFLLLVSFYFILRQSKLKLPLVLPYFISRWPKFILKRFKVTTSHITYDYATFRNCNIPHLCPCFGALMNCNILLTIQFEQTKCVFKAQIESL